MQNSADQPRRPWDLLKLETPGLTASFWGAVALFTLAFFVTPYLPLIDYQQHVALAAILHRLFDASAPEHALYEVNLITYNGGFHLLVALLSYLMTPENAGRVVMATFPTLFALSALAVVREVDRPRWYACLALPITYSRGMSWGFANWNLTFPVALLGITWFLRYARGERAMLPRLLLCSCFCAYGHVLAMLCLCFGIGVIQLSRVRDLGPTWGARLGKLIASPLPVMPGILWCVFVFRYQTTSSFSNWEEASLDGLDDPLWYKLRHLLDMSVGNTYDRSDNILLGLALGVVFILTYMGAPEPRFSDDQAQLDLKAIRWLFLAFFGCYLLIPKVFVATWFVYERFPPLAMVFLTGAIPLRLMPHREELQAIAAGLGIAAGANTVRIWSTMGGAQDASAILDAIPANRNVVAVTYDPSTDRISREVYVHLLALYQARHPGQIAYTFAKFESMPVHYRHGKGLPPGPPGFEWDANKIDFHASWAHSYNVALVRAPASYEDPARLVFKEQAYRVKLMARRGRFWLYDIHELAKLEPLTLPQSPEDPLSPSQACYGGVRAVQPHSQSLWRFVALIYLAMAMLALGVVLVLRDGFPLDHPSPWVSLPPLQALSFSTLLGAVFSILVITSTRVFVAYFSWAQRLQDELSPFARGLGVGPVLLLAILSSSAEELFFRALLEPTVGLVLSSLLFGFAHQARGQIRWVWSIWAGVVGLGLGGIFHLTGSLAGALLAHAAINALNMLFLRGNALPNRIFRTSIR